MEYRCSTNFLMFSNIVRFFHYDRQVIYFVTKFAQNCLRSQISLSGGYEEPGSAEHPTSGTHIDFPVLWSSKSSGYPDNFPRLIEHRHTVSFSPFEELPC